MSWKESVLLGEAGLLIILLTSNMRAAMRLVDVYLLSRIAAIALNQLKELNATPLT